MTEQGMTSNALKSKPKFKQKTKLTISPRMPFTPLSPSAPGGPYKYNKIAVELLADEELKLLCHVKVPMKQNFLLHYVKELLKLFSLKSFKA